MGENAEEGGGLNLGLSIGGCFTGSTGFRGMYCRNKEDAEEFLEKRRKKDLHALRRQAARRKRDEKRAKRAKTTGEDGEEGSTPGKEEEQKRPPSDAGYPNGGFPFVPMMQYVIQNGDKVRYIPVTVPYVLPCWPASSPPPFPPALLSDASRDSDPLAAHASGTVYQPVPCRSVGGNHRAGPQSSTASSSSAVSDNKSGSGSTSDSRSHSQSEQCRQGSVSSLAQSAEAQSKPHSPLSLLSGAVPENKEADSVNAVEDKRTIGATPASAPSNNWTISANAREEKGKPSPASASAGGGQKSVTAPSLPPMPCVSTTGDGPNGKTITGFLYRYTKREVSIMCVCHGNSFSPAEFIKHAGGTDTANPLRHIIVVPSPAG